MFSESSVKVQWMINFDKNQENLPNELNDENQIVRFWWTNNITHFQQPGIDLVKTENKIIYEYMFPLLDQCNN